VKRRTTAKVKAMMIITTTNTQPNVDFEQVRPPSHAATPPVAAPLVIHGSDLLQSHSEDGTEDADAMTRTKTATFAGGL